MRILYKEIRSNERKLYVMKKWMQSPMRVKRMYLVGAAGVLVVATGSVVTLLSKSESQTTPSQAVQPAASSNSNHVSSSGTTDAGVTRVPLNKTLDEARTEGLLDSSVPVSSSSNQTSDSASSGGTQTVNTVPSNSAPAATGSSVPVIAAQPGAGLDANTVSQLRSFGIREGDLSKIDKMVADGFDPKEIAQSLRKNGNNNLAAVMDQVPRKPKAEQIPPGLKKEEKAEEKAEKKAEKTEEKKAKQEEGDDKDD